MTQIEDKKGYKYQLVSEYQVDIPITPATDIGSPGGYVALTAAGSLAIARGYAWDGPSGPTIDTSNFMRGSLVHDALYQLMREELLDGDHHRGAADKLFRQMCKADGMSSARAWWVYKGLRIGGDPAADPDSRRRIIKAP